MHCSRFRHCTTTGSTLLTGRDRKFADWLRKQGGTIGISKALRRGDRAKIAGGPLAELGGAIIKIDWRKRRSPLISTAG